MKLNPDDVAIIANSLQRDARSLDALYHSVSPRMESFRQRARRLRFLAKKIEAGELQIEAAQ